MGGRTVFEDWPKDPGSTKFIIGDWNKMTSDCVDVDSLSLARWALGKPSEWSCPGGLWDLFHLLRFRVGKLNPELGVPSKFGSGDSDILWEHQSGYRPEAKRLRRLWELSCSANGNTGIFQIGAYDQMEACNATWESVRGI